MTFTDAAAEVLRLVGRPLHYKEITDIAIEKNLLSHVGKSPEVTMGARLAATLKKDSDENPLVRVKPGVFALREWDDKTIKAGLEPKRGAKKSHRHEGPAPEGDGASAAAKADVEASDEEDEVLVAAEADEEPALDGEMEAVEVLADEGEEVSVSSDEDEEGEPTAVAGHVGGPQTPAPAQRAADSRERAPDRRAPGSAPDRHAPGSAPDRHAPGSAPDRRAPGSAPDRQAPGRLAAATRAEEEDAEPPGPDDVMRAEAAAGAAEMFDEEEDDDQPILGGGEERAQQPGGEPGDGRRRRRRRRRGGRTNGEAVATSGGGGGGGLPSYTATPAFDNRGDNRRDADRRDLDRRDLDRRDSSPGQGAPVREGEAVYRPQVIELTGGEGHALDDLAGRELSDAVAVILSTFDRNAGAVSLRSIAETAQRRGRLTGDAQLVQSQVAAAVRADNARRIASGQRPRFRLAGGRVALTDWLLSGDLARLEQDALAAVERYRDAARRAFARKLGELPGHAFVEVCVLALEKTGIGQIRALRRAGVPGGESHFAGVLRTAAATAADELRIAIVIRRDGREVGRERVADLRGSLHHYGPANAGWVFTAGQILSGAREEAAVPGVAPIALFDGLAVARLCEDNDVAVIRARLPVAIPDVDLLEALRAS
jgi:hypothetical protein